MAERALEADATEEPLGEGAAPDAAVRPLPQARSRADLDAWRGEAKAIAVVAAGGLAAGAAAVVALSAAKSRSGSRARMVRRTRRDRDIVASRTFLVDVHVLGR